MPAPARLSASVPVASSISPRSSGSAPVISLGERVVGPPARASCRRRSPASRPATTSAAASCKCSHRRLSLVDDAPKRPPAARRRRAASCRMFGKRARPTAACARCRSGRSRAGDAAHPGADQRLVGDDLAGDRAAGRAGDHPLAARLAAGREQQRRERAASATNDFCIRFFLSPAAGMLRAPPRAGPLTPRHAAHATRRGHARAPPSRRLSHPNTSGKRLPRPRDVDPEHRLVARRIERLLRRHHLAPEQPAEPPGVEVAARERRRRRNAPRAPPGTPRPPPGRAAGGRR